MKKVTQEYADNEVNKHLGRLFAEIYLTDTLNVYIRKSCHWEIYYWDWNDKKTNELVRTQYVFHLGCLEITKDVAPVEKK